MMDDRRIDDRFVDSLRRIVVAWEELGRCEDEFGIGSDSCGERADYLDSAIAAAAAELASGDGVEAEGTAA